MGETSGILTALGGVGLFLLGMVLMTEGLQGLAGQSLRRVLRRFTKTPLRGVAAGTMVTALLQSSSATTVTVIGFVSAGLLTFSQGLGIVFGANIGTTFTGWLVAVLGFKLELEIAALPVVFIGGMMRLFGGRRVELAGRALSGFALLFLGIALMQQGMAGLSDVLTPEQMPGDSMWGRVQLVLLGAAITAVTQSSSAGVAAALVALDAGAIGLRQAAVMVVGMNIGTTVTALLATLGGSVAARQTGVAHLLFNLMTGVLAFVLLTFGAGLIESLAGSGDVAAERYALVIFHTVFNVAGVVLALALLDPFIAVIRRLVREVREPLVSRLDRQLLSHPGAAVDATCATVEDLARHMYGLLAARLSTKGAADGDGKQLRQGLRALDATRSYAEKINAAELTGNVLTRYLDILHALDHLARLGYRITQEDRARGVKADFRLRRQAQVLRKALVGNLKKKHVGQRAGRFDWLQESFRRGQRNFRTKVLEQAVEAGDGDRAVLGIGQASEELSTGQAIALMDAARWLHRVSYHVWRIEHHLERIGRSRHEAVPSAARKEALEDVRAD
ncbi:Na/Pi symporter [Alisedimentitalea sp. MJ-SS2]|uniref:Na/Pi cotransporter family protein n=1 Tax=Aliisedimentitalea sp. MJ-SS2 TaxID=3049795 RepID=UPI00290FF909|nr:Na/Pi symporter [Alisedimentitalea sp. MJ-SS2]MDU8927115.1 Na/Pi symporter [Alisedimentitalea sp. MJ-SS2]